MMIKHYTNTTPRQWNITTPTRLPDDVTKHHQQPYKERRTDAYQGCGIVFVALFGIVRVVWLPYYFAIEMATPIF